MPMPPTMMPIAPNATPTIASVVAVEALLCALSAAASSASAVSCACRADSSAPRRADSSSRVDAAVSGNWMAVGGLHVVESAYAGLESLVNLLSFDCADEVKDVLTGSGGNEVCLVLSGFVEGLKGHVALSAGRDMGYLEQEWSVPVR